MGRIAGAILRIARGSQQRVWVAQDMQLRPYVIDLALDFVSAARDVRRECGR